VPTKESTMLRFILTSSLFVCASVAFAGDAKFAKDFQPLPVKFPVNAISLKDAIALLEKQTGNPIVDLRKVHLSNPTMMLRTTTFWESLDALGIGFSPYQADGAIALIDTPYRKRTTHYSGPFRFAVKRMSVTRDDDTHVHYAQLSLEVAWEPRLQPLYLNLDKAAVTIGKAVQSIDRQPMKSVAGAGATEIDLRMVAPNRKALSLNTVSGSLSVIAAPRMAEFTFDKLKALSPDNPRDAKEQEGVKLRLLEVRQPEKGVPWKVRMLLTYPPESLVPLESFQSWYSNNKVWLSWHDPQTKALRTLDTTEQYEHGKDGTRLTMTFAPSETTPLPPANANVTLHLRTPSRVALVTVPFEFRDLPLP